MPGVLVAMTIATSPLPVSAETLESAMARAYVGNPSLGAQRASTRATDENVPRALSGYRPRVNATADVGAQFCENRDPGPAQPRDAHRHAEHDDRDADGAARRRGDGRSDAVQRLSHVQLGAAGRVARARLARDPALDRAGRAVQWRDRLYGRAARHG